MNFMKLAYAFLFVFLLPHLLHAAEVSRPNILFIAIDDLNDWIGCMKGHPQARTPNIDSLAERGILFTNAHCAAPVCLASRTAVLCGRYPDETGVFSNWGKTQGKPPARNLQLPVHFASAGYKTLGTGKIYHSKDAQYFDEFFDTHQRWSPFTQDQVRYTPDELPSKGSVHPRHVVRQGPGSHVGFYQSTVYQVNATQANRTASRLIGDQCVLTTGKWATLASPIGPSKN